MKPSILVVDDDGDICQMMAEFLRGDGYNIDVSNGVTSAISFMKSNDYDILLIDKNMPGLDGKSQEGGMDLLRHVRAKSIPSQIIMMTGDASIDTAVEAMRLGAFDYLLKPLSLKELKVKINRISDYRSFFNRDGVIELYKSIKEEIMNLFKNKSSMTDIEIVRALISLNEKIDKIFMALKESEKFALEQRESLAHIASNAEQMKLHISETHESYGLIDEICNYSSRRL